MGLGKRLYLPGGSGEPTCLVNRALETPEAEITTSFVPGINMLTSDMIKPGSRVCGPFMHRPLAAAQRDGRYRHMPLSYAAMSNWLQSCEPFDACFVQVTPPDAQGRCSLGPAAEFTPGILSRARHIVAAVNPAVPRPRHAPVIAIAACAEVVETATPLVGYDVGPIDPATHTIADLVAARIPDGATLQVGLGKVPHALMGVLQDRRGLRLHSGMLSDGVIELADSGALDPQWRHVTTSVIGKPELYDWLADQPNIDIRGVEYTHDPARLAGLERFIAVNSALEIDLFGQCNLEFAAGRAISGAGGAPDFSRAARLCRDGLSIIALPATFGSGTASRIRPWLGATSIVSVPRHDLDLVVTEHGVADLRGLSVHERADALIAIAAPFARAGLAAQWREITAGL